MNIVILDSYALNPGDLDWTSIANFGQLTIYDRTAPEEVIARSINADIILTNKAKVSEEAIKSLPQLKYIGELATGFDNISIQTAAERNIPVCNIPGYSTRSVAQLTWALILDFYNQVYQRSIEVKNGEWCKSKDFTYNHQGISDLNGKTLGLIGLGAIGSEVAKIGLAFGMNIIAAVRHPEKYHTNEIKITNDLPFCFANADIVSLHCPLTTENNAFVNSALLTLMKPNAILVNTARGALINELDLADALNANQIAGAALDVLSSEPPPSDNPLLSAKNCLITPHVGWASLESRSLLMEIAAANIKAFIEGKPQNVVNGIMKV